MKNILKLTGVSVLAIMATANANAAGYTCEELVEYTSCNPGYYLSPADLTCPDGYDYGTGWCYIEFDDQIISVGTEEECAEEARVYGNGVAYDFIGDGCFSMDLYYENYDKSEALAELNDAVDGSVDCMICPAGSSCTGGTAGAVACAAGTYQPNAGQASCIDAPVGNYVVETGATAYTACPASGMIDASGNVVSVTTASTGSTSATACFVAKGVEFKDDKGIYRFTENCHTSYNFVKAVNNGCPNGYMLLDNYDGDDAYCINKLPDTEAECLDVAGGAAWWDDESENCVCDDYSFEFSEEFGLMCRGL